MILVIMKDTYYLNFCIHCILVNNLIHQVQFSVFSYFLIFLLTKKIGKGLKRGQFKNITNIAGKFAKNFGYGFDSINELLFKYVNII